MIKTAYLRVYVPSSTVVDLPPHRGGGDRLRASGPFLMAESTTDDGIYAVWQSGQYVCPRNARLRMIEGALAFTKLHPGMRLLRDQDRLAYVGELASLRKGSAHARSFILSSAWHVPLRWFAAFSPSERELYESDGGSSIRYRTSLGEAIDRIHWAVSVLDGAGFSDQVVRRVEDLERWLTEFAADSMVELDYAAVAESFPATDLAFDESASDVRSSLLALEQSDFATSGEFYERVARRWADQQAYTLSN